MYIVSICANGMSFNYTFNTFDAAKAVFQQVQEEEGYIEVRDDFGSRGYINTAGASANLTDLVRDMDRAGEQQILQAKATLRAQKKAESDVGLHILNNRSHSTQ